MTKQAHITSRPEYEVGDRVLALCGKDFKVKVLWDELPKGKPICRDCVDVALDALTEADAVINDARRTSRTATLALRRVSTALTPDDDLVLDVIAENEDFYTDQQEQAKQAEEDEKREQVTCICEWQDSQTRITDPDCPIHGKDARPPVAPEGSPKTVDS